MVRKNACFCGLWIDFIQGCLGLMQTITFPSINPVTIEITHIVGIEHRIKRGSVHVMKVPFRFGRAIIICVVFMWHCIQYLNDYRQILWSGHVTCRDSSSAAGDGLAARFLEITARAIG